MSHEKIGLKTLVKRLDELEGRASKSFASNLIINTQDSVNQDLEGVYDHYIAGLVKLSIDIENVKLVDLVRIVPYTITYVEQNINVIANILKKSVSGGLKLNCAITFLSQLSNQDKDFLEAWVNSHVDLMFNKAKGTLNEVLVNTNKKSLSLDKGSISKKSSCLSLGNKK